MMNVILYKTPIFDPDGNLITESGSYEDQGFQIDLQPDLVDIRVSSSPTLEEAQKALIHLKKDALGEFVFNSHSDLTQTIGLMLLPFMRQMIEGPVPVFVIESEDWGSGKIALSYLIELLGGGDRTTTGLSRASRPMMSDLRCYIQNSCPVHVFGSFGIGPQLNRQPLIDLAMKYVWDMIPSRGKKRIKVHNRGISIIPGKNPKSPRVLLPHISSIRLEIVYPVHPLANWSAVIERQRELFISCLTIIQYWISKGKPEFKGSVKPGFERYSELLGGILQTVGLDDFLANEVESCMENVG